MNKPEASPSIKKYGLLPYNYEIQLWDIKRSLPVPGQEAQRKEAWKMLRRGGYTDRLSRRLVDVGWDEEDVDVEMGDAQGGGRKKRTKRKKKTKRKRKKKTKKSRRRRKKRTRRRKK